MLADPPTKVVAPGIFVKHLIGLDLKELNDL